MQAIATDIYIEEQYPGVTLGAISLPHGLIQIEPRPPRRTAAPGGRPAQPGRRL